MRTIAIINQKGGCGKTTTAINLSACLARLGHRTLLVDMDPQGHCGTGLAVPEDQIQRTIFDTVIEPSDGPVATLSDITWQIATDFDLAPANIKLAGFEQIFAGRPGRERRLGETLATVKDKYAWCIIDCPPGVGLLTFNALVAADEVVIPVETGYFSLHGLGRMVETLEELRDQSGRDILIRVLPTLYDTRTKLAREVLAELRGKFRDVLMRSTVNFNTKLKEAASFGQPITEYDPGSRGYKDFVNLARELMGERPVQVETQRSDEPLSRPAELVQRARQLAQLSASKFGRGANKIAPPRTNTTSTTPSEPGQASHVEPTLRIVEAMTRPTPQPTPQPMPGSHLRIEPKPDPIPLPRPESATVGTVGFKFRAGDIGDPGEAGRMLEMMEVPQRVSRPQIPTGPIGAPRNGAAPAELGEQTEFDEAGGSDEPETSTQARIDAYYGIRQSDGETTFVARFDNARRVQIAGDFNNWSVLGTPLARGEKPGSWRTRLPLPAGKYRYRFIVDGAWVTDPHNGRTEVNEFGELNNIVEIA